VFLRAFLLALALFPERERERERDHNTHSYRPFLRLERKSPRVSSVFFNPHRLFLPQKKEKIIIIERAKILARTQTLLKARFENKSERKSVLPRERERESLCVDVVRKRLEDAFYSENVLRETTERERVRKNFIRVVVKTERRFRRTHVGSEKKTKKIRETL